MITYAYRCLDCEARFEVRQKITDEALRECPECGGSVRRQITGGLCSIVVDRDSGTMCPAGGG